MKHVAILCGAKTYEHEVSIITGMQVAKSIDRKKYSYSLIYFDKNNDPFLIKDFSTPKDFTKNKRVPVYFVKKPDGVYLVEDTMLRTKHKIDVCYLGFHGGSGESGPVQGMLELLGVPFTSPSCEGSVITMNKALTKEVLKAAGLPILPHISVVSATYEKDKAEILSSIENTFSFPVIIKPVHLGSSIAIEIAHNATELEKFLNVAVRVDTEILIEPALTSFTEFNVSVRSHDGGVELSPIEEPKREEEMLSFEDKYTKGGGKKSGNKQGGGMELLDRTVPAKISSELANDINTLAVRVYTAARLAGLVRIDFLYAENKLYCTEINPIPGSMSFYLWEAAGEQFKDQITISIEDALTRHKDEIDIEPYETDIVEKFISWN